jgi:hypothetical protein
LPPRDFRPTFPAMFSGLTPTTNFILRIALAFGAGLMMAALL